MSGNNFRETIEVGEGGGGAWLGLGDRQCIIRFKHGICRYGTKCRVDTWHTKCHHC